MKKDMPRFSSAFTLLELSIVLVIAGVVVAAAMVMGRTAIREAERVKTMQRLEVIKSSLEQYARTNGRLPCPSERDYNMRTDPVMFGAPGDCHSLGDNPPSFVYLEDGGAVRRIFIGGVPTQALSLSAAYAGDAWGNKFTYAVTSRHVEAEPMGYFRFDGDIEVRTGNRTGTHYSLTTRTDRSVVPSRPTAITPGPNASYVVVSHGPDGRGAFPTRGTTITRPCGSGSQNDVENCNNDMVFWDNPYNDGSIEANYFDDLIVWGSNALERTPINAVQPSCPVGVCESWCAQCVENLPALSPVPAPSGLIFNGTNPTLCKKMITKSLPCEATCIWAGTISGGVDDGKVVRCP